MEKNTFDTLAPIKYDVNLAQIAKLKEQYMSLEITDLNDKEQFDAVHAGRMIMVKVRTTIEKARIEQKAKSLEYGRAVDAAAGVLFDESTPIEKHLQAEENKVIKEKERIKAEEERIEKEKLQARIEALGKYQIMLPFFDIAAMTEEEFQAKLTEAKTAFEAEEERLAKEKAEREAEEARIVSERAELTRIREEQEAKAKAQEDKEKALVAERKALDDAKQAEEERKNREAFERQVVENAKIQAEKDAKEKVEREDREKKEREEAEKIEAARQEALKPDREKLIDFARRITEVPVPEVEDEMAERIIHVAIRQIIQVSDNIIEQLEEL